MQDLPQLFRAWQEAEHDCREASNRVYRRALSGSPISPQELAHVDRLAQTASRCWRVYLEALKASSPQGKPD